MPAADRRLKILEAELDALGEAAMVVSELDGYLTGILVCPELIPPAEWLPPIWGETGEDDAVAAGDMFDSKEHLDDVIAAIMAHYNAIGRVLHERPEKHAPILEIDEESGEILWEAWAQGFEAAMRLRVEAWAPLSPHEDSEEEDVTEEIAAMNLMVAFVSIACGYADDMDFTPEQIEMMTQEAPSIIPGVVTTLNAWRMSQRSDPHPRAGNGPKVGRNDPCPCGSGKKYKKCCGLT